MPYLKHAKPAKKWSEEYGSKAPKKPKKKSSPWTKMKTSKGDK